MFSIDDLDAVKACGNPFEFEYKFGNGKGSGVFISVLGDESETVAVETAAIMAAERARKEAAEAQGKEYQFDAVKLGKQMAAIRIQGWRGIKEEFTPENALKLCMSNTAIADQVMQHSKNLGNFIRL
jgi:hypothetical protein